MKTFAQLKENRIKQIAIDFEIPPFDNAIEISEEIAKAPDDWIYENGQFIYSPKPEPAPPEPEPTAEEILLAAYQKIAELEARIQVLESGGTV